jgi:hypothetical protein
MLPNTACSLAEREVSAQAGPTVVYTGFPEIFVDPEIYSWY